MAAIRPSEILDLGDYERARPELRARAMAARAARRVSIGPAATIVFENRETVRYQIQEMLRAERIVGSAEIAHEIETYSELLPGPGELSATLMLEFPDAVERPRRLAELVGLERHVVLEVGAARVPARFDPQQLDPERVSAVQFVRFPLGDALAALRRGAPARLAIDHPCYGHTADLPPAVVAAILSDLEPP
jgi:hypothetical protein